MLRRVAFSQDVAKLVTGDEIDSQSSSNTTAELTVTISNCDFGTSEVMATQTSTSPACGNSYSYLTPISCVNVHSCYKA